MSDDQKHLLVAAHRRVSVYKMPEGKMVYSNSRCNSRYQDDGYKADVFISKDQKWFGANFETCGFLIQRDELLE